MLRKRAQRSKETISMLPTLKRLRNQWFALRPRTDRRCAPRRRRCQPLVERLEDRVVPTTIVGLDTANLLIRYDATSPNAATPIGTVTNLATGDVLFDIDFRPA